MSQRYAQIVDDVVVNIILADPGFDPGDGSTLVQSDTAQIGDAYDEGTGVFTTPPPPPPPPPDDTLALTFMQFMALFTSTEQDALLNNGYVQALVFGTNAPGGTFWHVDDPVFTQGISDLATGGVIDSARVSDILAGIPPA